MEIKRAERKGETMNITSILVWLKVNNFAEIQYQSKQDDDHKYYDFMTHNYYTKNQILELAKENGYDDEKF